MTLDFAPVHRRTVSDQVADAIRTKILTGELPPGSRLREVEIAEKLGVSRGTLREAFRQLVGERLLVARANHGVFVWSPDRHEVWELYTLRAGIEGMCLRLVFMAGRQDDLGATLRSIVDRMRAADAAGERAEPLDHEFHRAIVVAAANRQFLRIWSGVHPVVWHTDLPAFIPDDLGSMADRHAWLVQTIAQGTAVEAQEALVAHVLDGMQVSLRMLAAASNA